MTADESDAAGNLSSSQVLLERIVDYEVTTGKLFVPVPKMRIYDRISDEDWAKHLRYQPQLLSSQRLVERQGRASWIWGYGQPAQVPDMQLLASQRLVESQQRAYWDWYAQALAEVPGIRTPVPPNIPPRTLDADPGYEKRKRVAYLKFALWVGLPLLLFALVAALGYWAE